MTAKAILSTMLRSRGRAAFLSTLPERGKVLDVGCGNDSPRYFKSQRPDLHYVGLDVADYNQHSAHEFADDYILTTPQDFARSIASFENQLDAVVSAHNLEHCLEPYAVLDAMLKALRPGGRIYLAFPCEESVAFPRRAGTLNFYDDATHRTVPDWNSILAKIVQERFSIDFAARRYRPFPMRCVGMIVEPLSARRHRVMRGTWDFFGFESVIWASRSAIF